MLITEQVSRIVPHFHHVGIQTADLENSINWYTSFLDAEVSWSLETFSDLTRQRLPGITRLVELNVGTIRLHLFERPGVAMTAPGAMATQFQHVCLDVSSGDDLVTLRDRWVELRDSGAYSFAVADEPTLIVVDADGVRSFYAFDVNGLELELTFDPAGRQ